MQYCIGLDISKRLISVYIPIKDFLAPKLRLGSVQLQLRCCFTGFGWLECVVLSDWLAGVCIPIGDEGNELNLLVNITSAINLQYFYLLLVHMKKYPVFQHPDSVDWRYIIACESNKSCSCHLTLGKNKLKLLAIFN